MNSNTTLKKEADVVLGKIIPVLSRFGKVCVLGSYNLDTMAWKDLDIAVHTEDLLPESIFGILKGVGESLFPTELLLKDYSHVLSKNGNKGRYIQCKDAHIAENTWDKIDIVLSDNENDIQEQVDRNDYWKGIIKETDKDIIVKIKEHFYTHPLYRKDILSVDIYRAVSLEGVHSLEGFAEWLERVKGIVV